MTDETSMKTCAKVLSLCPEVLTAWNHRREAIERGEETRRADARWFFRTFELISVHSSRASGRGTWTRDEEVRCRITRMIRARGCG